MVALSTGETYRFRRLADPNSTRVRRAVYVTLMAVSHEPSVANDQDRSSQEADAAQSLDLTWLFNDQPGQPASPASLRELYRGIQQSLRQSDYKFIDTLYRAADVELLPAETLVGMLRYAFSAHRKLENWKPFRQKVHDELGRRGADPERLLAGLRD
jgi:hypothetical protein